MERAEGLAGVTAARAVIALGKIADVLVTGPSWSVP
jgi:hypothetical protein